MTTRESVKAGCRPCPECKGEGREWHGLVDATCTTCKGRGLALCAKCEAAPARHGPLCPECRRRWP